MQDKESFGKYISEKRKDVNLTQEELAKRLHVLSTTISKWERGVTYPDISMITSLCKELNISEHEFFTACDDEVMNKEKREIHKYRALKKWIFILLNLGYIIGLISTFICNLVIEHKLSWFFVVLLGILISFSITTIPYYLKDNKYKLFKISGIITLLVYLLLFTINYVFEGNWLLDSIYIASFVFIFLWIIVLICTLTKISIAYKVSISLFILSFLIAFTNPFCAEVLNISNNESNIPNIICAAITIIISLAIALRQFLAKRIKL